MGISEIDVGGHVLVVDPKEQNYGRTGRVLVVRLGRAGVAWDGDLDYSYVRTDRLAPLVRSHQPMPSDSLTNMLNAEQDAIADAEIARGYSEK